MLRLRTFGGVALARDGVAVDGVASGSTRALALLALLAAAGERGLARDALLPLFWPEVAEGAARHSLDQLLLTARRATGREGIAGTATLRLDPIAVATDVAAFRDALHGERWEQAVALHEGPFADGLAIRGAPEVEQRLAVLRAGFARAHEDALERLARRASAQGEHAEAMRWWQRRADADPLSAGVTRELVAACVAAGEPARALRQAQLHESLVRQEGLPVDAAVAGWIARLRTGHATPAAVRAVADGSPAARYVAGVAEAGDAELERRRVAPLVAAVGARWRVGRLLEEGTLVASWAATRGDDASREGELHLVQPRAATVAATERFLQVMHRVAALASPQLLPVLDVGATRDVLWFATAARLPLSLRERLSRERALPVDEARAIGRALAAALALAHAHDLHHGDLRPRHVGLAGASPLLGGLGVVAAVVAPAHRDDGRSTIVSLGSPAYLAPEQLAGDVHADARSDVYALGGILYEMLAGDPPYGRRSHGAQLRRKLAEPPPPLATLRESVPAPLAGLVHACLARVPADRPTMSEVTTALVAGMQ